MPWGTVQQPDASSGFDPTGLVLSAATGGVGAIANAISAANARKRQAQLEQQQAAEAKAARDQSTQVTQATEDPFRQQMFQAGDISKLDQLERARFSPVHLGSDPNYGRFELPRTGGFSYEKSPDVISSAAALKRNVMGGNVAPDMSDPTNAGKTATLNLLKIASAGADPGSVNGSAGAPRSLDAYTAGVNQRTVGGIGTAETRGTDVSVENATAVLTKAIQSELGRPPNPGEIAAMLAGQGLKQGDHWVGSGGLNYILNALRSARTSAPQAPVYTGVG